MAASSHVRTKLVKDFLVDEYKAVFEIEAFVFPPTCGQVKLLEMIFENMLICVESASILPKISAQQVQISKANLWRCLIRNEGNFTVRDDKLPGDIQYRMVDFLRSQGHPGEFHQIANTEE